MSDEERIAKLQKLLDRVLTRGESEEASESQGAAGGANGERTQISGDPPPDPPPAAEAPAPEAERAAEPPSPRVAETKDDDAPIPDAPIPAALESRSRLVTAHVEPDAEELTEDDLEPASESSLELEAAAVPLVRRSKRPATVPPRAEDPEPISEGRIPLNLADVQIAEEAAEKSLAEEIAAEEVHSGEIEEEAPASSRRPIDTDGDARAADSPPESGKQVAAAPFESPTSSTRKSTLPPTGGRVGPDIIRAEVGASTRVASIVPPVPPRPASFGDLIDLALDL
jgi:hypothetical protein